MTGAGGLNVGDEFDAVGNLIKLRTADQAEPPLRGYAYDGLNRLIETKNGATGALLEGYTYDSTGNRTSATVGGATTAYSTSGTSHRLTAVGATARGYDEAGNTTQIGTNRTFVYDDLGRMRQVLESGVATRNYAYNGNGEQVHTWLAANDDRYHLYADGGQWLGEYDSTGAPRQQIVWFNGLPVAVLTGSGANQTLHYIEADALGTPRVIVDPTRGASGTVVWRWELTGEAFGNTAPNEDPDNDGTAFVFDMRFPGQRYDSASGLNYNYFRDYEPGTGRYVESDPIGLGGGISTYGYAGGKPLTTVDPDGLQEVLLTPRFLIETQPWQISRPFPGAGTVDPAGVSPYIDYGDPNGWNNSEYCRSLARRIKNTTDEIYNKRWIDLLTNPLRLPWRIGPGEALKDTVRGHEKLLNRRLRELRKLEDEYDQKCRSWACESPGNSLSPTG